MSRPPDAGLAEEDMMGAHHAAGRVARHARTRTAPPVPTTDGASRAGRIGRGAVTVTAAVGLAGTGALTGAGTALADERPGTGAASTDSLLCDLPGTGALLGSDCGGAASGLGGLFDGEGLRDLEEQRPTDGGDRYSADRYSADRYSADRYSEERDDRDVDSRDGAGRDTGVGAPSDGASDGGPAGGRGGQEVDRTPDVPTPSAQPAPGSAGSVSDPVRTIDLPG